PGSGGWSENRDQKMPVQLYHLKNDIGEKENLSSKEPDRVDEMQNILEQLIINGRSTPGEMQANDVEVRRYPRSPERANNK
ncbi:MAG: hypothetical protein P8I27_01085, partial [Pirellulaceae bacterium]|nr:hypothetical protein [Pirellulaceae bacterium]